MSTVTPILNLVKPATVEQFSLATYNNNLDAIDAAFPQIDYANSAVDDGTWGMKSCRFTRFRMGTKGIIVADFNLSMSAVALPVNTAAPLSIAGVVPAGYRPIPGPSLPLQMANLANSGAGQLVQLGIKNDGAWQIRSAGSAFTATAGATLMWSTAYRWDGSLV